MVFEFKKKNFSFDFYPFFMRFFIQALFGLIGGVTIDYGFDKLTKIIKEHYKEFDKNTDILKLIIFCLGFFQLLVSFIFLYILIILLPHNIYQNWQNAISGLAFPAIYYGIQITMFNNIKFIYSYS